MIQALFGSIMLMIFPLEWMLLIFWSILIFKTHLFCYFWLLSYCCLVWAQNSKTIQQILILQKKKAVRIINFQPRNFHTSPLFKENSILKLQDKICQENILFVSKSLDKLSLSVFNTWFSFSSDQCNYEPQVLHKWTSWNFFISQIDMGSIQ